MKKFLGAYSPADTEKRIYSIMNLLVDRNRQYYTVPNLQLFGNIKLSQRKVFPNCVYLLE